jgi:transposase
MANRRGEELTDEQWAIIAPLIPEPPRREDGRGRPWKDTREVINGVLWILRSGARWQDLPDRFPPYQTCHRRFQQWSRDGTLRNVLEALAEDLRVRGEIDLSECFIDGTFIVAKKGAQKWERLSGAKARSSWQWQTLLVFHSPSTRRVLRRMKSPLSQILSFKVLSLSNQSG